jgi:homocysteine S-methyltransferase
MAADRLTGLLRAGGTVVLDGGLATELERRGADLRDPLWSARSLIEAPDLIREVHAAYAAAGAQVSISASYQASFEGFATRGIDRDGAAALMRRSVELARAGAPGGLVAASVGPYGAVSHDGSEYTGAYGLGEDALYRFHAGRLEVLADPGTGADLLAVETIPSIVEAEALVRALDEHPEVPAWMSFTCADEGHLHDGTPIEDAVAVALEAPSVVAVGVNCTAPQHVASLVGRVRAAAPDRLAVLAYPNLGAAYDARTKTWGPSDPAAFGAWVPRWTAAGASLLGGCCGTGPADIEAIAAALGHETVPEGSGRR